MSTAIIPLGSIDILPPPVQNPDSLRDEVDALLDAIRNQELRLATSYVRFGRVLLEVRSTESWREWGFRSFGAYVNSLRVRIDRGRSQIYQVISVAEKLLPMVDAGTLERIGISKAAELKRFVMAQPGRLLPAHLVALAEDEGKGIDELRAAVFEALHQKPDPKGKYMDWGGFFATDDERAEIERAFQVACRVDPVIPRETPEPMQKKEVMLRWAREFLSTYAAEVESLPNG